MSEQSLSSDQISTIPVVCVASAGLNKAINLTLGDVFMIDVLASWTRGKECLARMPEFAPCVLLVGEQLEDMAGVELAQQIKLSRSDVAVLMLSTQADQPEFLHKVMGLVMGVIPATRDGDEWGMMVVEAQPRISQAWSTIAPTFGPAERGRRFILTFYGTKGGVGKSVIAASLAARLAMLESRPRILLVDLNIQFGIIHQLLGLEPTHTIVDFARILDGLDRQQITDMIQHRDLPGKHTLYVLPAPVNGLEGDDITEGNIRTLLAALRLHFDFLVIDTPAIFDRTLAALEAADRLLMICEPDVFSIYQTRTALGLLPRLGLAEKPVALILNKILDDKADTVIRSEHLEKLFQEQAQVVARLPNAPKFVQEMLNQGLLPAESPKAHPWLREVDQIMSELQLIGEPVERVAAKEP